MKNFNEVVAQYLKENGIKMNFFSEYIGCTNTMKCSRWLRGMAKLNENEMKKAHDFINGKFLKSVDEILREDE